MLEFYNVTTYDKVVLTNYNNMNKVFYIKRRISN